MKVKHFLIILAALCLMQNYAIAGSVQLTWQANSEPDLNEYRVYYGSSSRAYGTPVPVGNVTSYTLSGLQEGSTYYLAVTAVDTSDNESGYSNEVVKQIVSNEPPPPVDPPPSDEIISNVTVSSGNSYELIKSLKSGESCYVDKTYKYRNIPDTFSNATFIKTFYDDRKSEANPYISFDVNDDATVYVAYDTRVRIPSWLNNFTKTDESVNVSSTPHILFAKDFASGSSVNLGGADASWAHMYTIIIVVR